MLIPNERFIDKRFRISRDDGSTWTDLTEYLQRIRIDYGDTSGIGVNPSGVDGVLRTASFVLHNDIGDNFNPAVKDSSWNLVGGVWSPLLWSYRRIKFETSIYDTKIEVKNEMIGIGDGIATEFYAAHAPFVNGVTGISLYTASATWWDNTTTPWDDITGDWDTLGKIADVASIGYTVDNATGKITFDSPPGVGVNIQIQSYHYWKNNSGFIPVFEGYLGESIQCGDYSVSCHVQDLSKKLQDRYIETETQYGSVGGDAAETVIQAIMDDNLGSGVVTLYTPVSPGFAVLNTQASKIGYSSVWDAVQKITGMFGWYIGYKLDWYTLTFRLTLMAPPRLKSHSLRDFELDHNDDFYSQTLEISDRDIRNKWTVTFKNQSTGLRDSVTVKDDNSIAQFTTKAAKIEQGDADMIDTTNEATNLANAALADTKYATGLTRLELPFLHNMDIFSGVLTHHPKLSSTVDFYGVQSISHELDWSSNQQRFRTSIAGIGQVVGGSQSWQHVMARPGGNPPKEGLTTRTGTIETDRLSDDVRAKTSNSPSRQTVLWASDPANLLTAGTGLNVTLGSCVISFASGFDIDGSAKNYLKYISSAVTNAWTVPPSSRVFLYADYAVDGTLTYSYTKIPGQYESAFDISKNVVIDFEGPNGSTTVTDKYGNAAICNGNAQISTAQYAFGTSSLVCDGTNDYLEIESISDLDGSPWMMRCKIRWAVLPAVGTNSIVFASTNQFSFWLGLNNATGTRKLGISLSSTGASNNIASGSLGTKTDWLADTWYDIVLLFDGSNYKVYVDGGLDKTVASALSLSAAGGVRIGVDYASASDFNGYIDDFEFIAENYAYSAAFTPSAEAATADSHWFDTNNKRMYYGSPEDGWLNKHRVFIGECVSDATAITSVVIYALEGKSTADTISVLALSQMQPTPHRLGKKPSKPPQLSLLCYAADNGYNPGDAVPYFPNFNDGTNARYFSISYNRDNVYSMCGPAAFIVHTQKTGGTGPAITMSKWKFRYYCESEL